MAVIITLPLSSQLTNGTTADATQVMADLNAIANSVNLNAAPLATTANSATLALGTGSTLIGTQQTGTGAVVRTQQAKNSENLSATDFGNIQQAITAAGANGSVTIPASYAGTDTYSNPSVIPITDLRNNHFGVTSLIEPARGVTNFPFGNDLNLRCNGPSDMHFEHTIVATTTTQSLTVGANTVLIAAVTLGNVRLGVRQTGDSTMFGRGANIIIGRETANEEQITPANWSYIDATHIGITCANTHSGTTDIEQIGSTLIESWDLQFWSGIMKPAQAGNYPQMRLKDIRSNIIAKIPGDNIAPAPYGLWQFNVPLAGYMGANQDLQIQSSTATSSIRYKNNNGTDIAVFSNNGNFELMQGGLAIDGNAVTNGSVGALQFGKNAAAYTSVTDAFITWSLNGDPLNSSNVAGSLVVASRNLTGCTINFATQNTLRGSFSATGLQVNNGFGCNTKTPQAAVASGGTLAGVIAALVANGILSS